MHRRCNDGRTLTRAQLLPTFGATLSTTTDAVLQATRDKTIEKASAEFTTRETLFSGFPLKSPLTWGAATMNILGYIPLLCLCARKNTQKAFWKKVFELFAMEQCFVFTEFPVCLQSYHCARRPLHESFETIISSTGTWYMLASEET